MTPPELRARLLPPDAPAPPAGTDSAALMRHTCYALLPAAAVLSLLGGAGSLGNLCLAVAAALLSEAALLRLGGRRVAPALRDGSAILSAAILALALAPAQPWWIPLCGAVAAMCVKHAYGGLGCNPFNPAMAGYALLLVAFPQQLRPAFLSGGAEIAVNIAFLAGGLYLIARRICAWEAPLALLAMLALCSLWRDGAAALTTQLLGGVTMLGTFFIITDPVTGAATRGGRLLCGAATGVLLFVLRSRGLGQGDIAFAVLLVNFATPMLDFLLLRRRRGLGGAGV